MENTLQIHAGENRTNSSSAPEPGGGPANVLSSAQNSARRPLRFLYGEGVSDLLARLERVEQLAQELEAALQIQFTRIAQMQAELDQLRPKNSPIKGAA